MGKLATTLYIDEGLLRAARDLAVRTGTDENEVVEEALAKHLLRELLDRTGRRANLSEEEAMRLANDEVRAMRRETGG